MGAGERPKEPPPKGAVVVALGSNGIIVTKDEKVPIIKLDECVLLAIQRTPSGLLVDASVYDVDGKVLARIDNNAFQGLEGENSQTRREGDLSTLIVRHQQAERLWVHYANKAAIQIPGAYLTATNRSLSRKVIAT